MERNRGCSFTPPFDRVKQRPDGHCDRIVKSLFGTRESESYSSRGGFVCVLDARRRNPVRKTKLKTIKRQVLHRSY